MPKASRLGDTGSAHSCHFPPTPAIEGSPDVFINGKPAFRVDDALAAHGCPSCPAPAHGRVQAAGSATVNINGKPAARIGDAIACGGVMSTGSPDVIIGDDTWGAGSDRETPARTFLISQMPGDARFAYRNEPYKLYHNGALVQEGRTGDDGTIVYENDDLTGTFTVEAVHGVWTYGVQAHPPAETDDGAQSRLVELGYARYEGWSSASSDAAQESGLHWCQGSHGEDLNRAADDTVKNLLKAIVP